VHDQIITLTAGILVCVRDERGISDLLSGLQFFKKDSRAIFSVISDENLEERCILPLHVNVPRAKIDLVSVIGLPLV
jgi:hypothetical protein